MGRKYKKRDDNQRVRVKDESNKESKVVFEENDEIFTIEILRIIQEAQQIHGLRHGDYRRYRTYCSNKVRRLRRLLKLAQADKRHYRKKSVEISHLSRKGADPKLLHVPLFLTERAWAYAMEIRSENNDDSRKRFHMIRRLKKATAHAVALDELCQTKYCDAQTKLESEAYLCWIRGLLNFELQIWEKAAENFNKSHIIYKNLASTITDLGNQIYQKKAYEIHHNLRFCYYNLESEENDINIFQFRGEGILDNLELLLKQTKKRRNEELRDIEWYDLKIAVRPEKVRTFLFAIQSLDSSLESMDKIQEKIKLLEQILVDCRDVITIAMDDMKVNKHNNHGLITYLTFIRLTRTVQRNTLMMEQSDKEKNVTRWYEIILELVEELEKLCDNEEYQQDLLKIAYFKPVRFVSLGKILEKRGDYQNSIDALELYDKALSEAQSLPIKVDSDEKLRKLLDDIHEYRVRVMHTIDDLEEKQNRFQDVEEDFDQFVDAVDVPVEETMSMMAVPKVNSEKKVKKAKKNKAEKVAVSDPVIQSSSEEVEVSNLGGLASLVKGLWNWGSQTK